MHRPKVDSLHEEVDGAAARVAARNAGRLRCGRGCAACCVDGLTVYEVEAERIRRAHAPLLAEGTPHPTGACAFLDESGACRIYPDRPYVCRTQGLPLRWLHETSDGEIAEERDVCELNREGPPLADLDEADLWLLGPYEERLAALQHAADGGAGRRVALRALFRKPAG
ncbi:MAG: YkgJ family cysteine cluster protein [Myxococcota bacterium]